MTRHRVVLFGATLAFYITIVLAVVTSSWLVRFDWQAMLFRPYQQWPEIHAFLDYWVVLGQRGPTAVMVVAWLGWRSWRQRTLRPLLAFGAALLLLNITVAAVKYGLGRSGPHYATDIGSNEMWHWFQAGSDIFPSGHTANAVVTWGILAYLASTPGTRRWLSALSAVVSLSVGLTTVYLGTHWLSDVLLGWAAGLLILLALPWFEPLVARAEAEIFSLRDRWRSHRATPATAPAEAPTALKPRTPAQQEPTTPEPISTTPEPVSTTPDLVSTALKPYTPAQEAPTAPEPVPTTPEPVSTTPEPVSLATEAASTALRPRAYAQEEPAPPESVPAAPEPVSLATEAIPTTLRPRAHAQEEPGATEPLLTAPEPVSAASEAVRTAPEPVSAASEAVRTAPEPVSLGPEPVTTTLTPRTHVQEDTGATEPVPTAPEPFSAATAPFTAARSPKAPVYLAPGPHTARSDRTPVTPVGSRRPPQADRVARGTATSGRPSP